jgi:predicted P-loop ATPase
MVRAGWDDNQIAPVLLDPRNGISAHVREQGNPGEYAARQALNAREKVEQDWERNEKGAIIASSLRNLRRALRALHFSARHDAFANRSLVTVGEAPERFLDDAVAERVWLAIEEEFEFRPPRDFFDTVLRDEARRNSFHPVLDYLSGLQWDGKKRIDTWLFDYGGVPRRDEAYNRYVAAVGRITLIAAVRRLRQPGCKFDEMLVLVSPTQGTDKSTARSVLAVCPEWFTDSIDLGAKDKEAIEQLAGKWIVEIAELRGRRKNDIDRIKAFLSRRCDRARLAWGRLPTEMQRQCVFFSSTNDVKFLQDRTGNRRYWPVLDVKFDVAGLERDVHQLWAEAAAAEAQGESIRLPKELWAVAEAVQGESLEEEPWVEVLDTALGQLEGKIRKPAGRPRVRAGGRSAHDLGVHRSVRCSTLSRRTTHGLPSWPKRSASWKARLRPRMCGRS